MRALVAAVTGAAVLVTVSACTSARTTSGEGSPIGAVSSTSSDTGTPTDTVTSPSENSTTPSTTAASTPASSVPNPAPAKSLNTCAFSQLGMRALRGSGAQQREYAAILFTNKGPTSCDIYGFPGVSLRYQNALLGQPATRDTSVAPTVIKLAPGAMVQADIVDNSSCQAPLSDTVRVYPPDSTKFVDLPLQLRGCSLTVKPVAAS